jgi:hypothetical protein
MRAADLTSPGPNSDLDEGLDPMRAWHIILQRFDEIEESVAFLRDLLKEEKFDVCFFCVQVLTQTPDRFVTGCFWF